MPNVRSVFHGRKSISYLGQKSGILLLSTIHGTTESISAGKPRGKQATIIVLDTQERDDAVSEDQHFLFQGPNQPTEKSKGYPKIINLSSKSLTEKINELVKKRTEIYSYTKNLIP